MYEVEVRGGRDGMMLANRILLGVLHAARAEVSAPPRWDSWNVEVGQV
jgi:hypothetical protein